MRRKSCCTTFKIRISNVAGSLQGITLRDARRDKHVPRIEEIQDGTPVQIEIQAVNVNIVYKNHRHLVSAHQGDYEGCLAAWLIERVNTDNNDQLATYSDNDLTDIQIQ